jgi:tetratricopeptide (TPR) repeat protein
VSPSHAGLGWGSGSPQARARPWLAAALALLAVVVYLPSLDNAPVYDDVFLVQKDPRVVESGHLGEIWSSDYWPGRRPSYNYRPLTTTSFAWVARLGTGQRGPNLLLHAACSLAAFGLALCLGLSALPAFVSGALFACHPLHSEALYLVVGRGELLAALFGLGFLIGVLRRWHGLGLALLYAAALLSKESAVMLPLLALLLWKTTRPDEAPGELARHGTRLLALAALPLALLFALRLRTFGLLLSPADHVDPLYNPLVALPTGLRVLNALWTQALYLASMLQPFPLRADYSWNQIELIPAFWDPRSALCLGLAGLTLFLLRHRRLRWTLETGGLLFVLLSLLPVSNLFFSSGVMFAERLTYLPLFGVCLVAGSLLQRLWCVPWRSRPLRAGLLVAPALVLGVFCAAVVRRDRAWRDADAFSAALVEDAPRSALAHGLRFRTLADAGRLADAEAHLLRALEIHPAYYDAWDSYGDLLAARRDQEGAARMYERAAREVSRTPRDASEAGPFHFKAARMQAAIGRCADARRNLAGAARWSGDPWPPELRRLHEQLEHQACTE